MASEVRGFLWVDSLDPVRNPPFPERWLRKPLKMSRNLRRAGAGGFRVDSPVKRPDARKVSGCAPPCTNRAGEEPCRGVSRPTRIALEQFRCAVDLGHPVRGLVVPPPNNHVHSLKVSPKVSREDWFMMRDTISQLADFIHV